LDQEAIQRAVTEIIKAAGEDPRREGLAETPRRIAEMYAEILSGMGLDPVEELTVGFEEGHQEMVVLKDIPFYSMCEHHFMPFFGTVAVGYLPNGRVVGISKIARVVEIFAKRLQLQERLTTQIADTIASALQPQGVAVVVRAEHLCISMRGVKKPGSQMVTSAVRGAFADSAVTRAEFMALINEAR
jgi:GTP cyclohydrolase I